MSIGFDRRNRLHSAITRPRTLAESLRAEELSRDAQREHVRSMTRDSSVRQTDPSYMPTGEGSGRRQPVRYE